MQNMRSSRPKQNRQEILPFFIKKAYKTHFFGNISTEELIYHIHMDLLDLILSYLFILFYFLFCGAVILTCEGKIVVLQF